MTELELKTRKEQLATLKEQEREIHRKIKDIEVEIDQHYLDKAKERFADLNVGDKIVVTEKGWDGSLHEHEPACFYDVRYSRYSFNRPECIELVLHKTKKDGTMGQREVTVYVDRIVKVEKVAE